MTNGEINPKAEFRSPKEFRMSKSESKEGDMFEFRISAFGFPSSFGLRHFSEGSNSAEHLCRVGV